MTKILAKRLMERITETNIIDEVQGVGKMGEASYNEARTLYNIIEDAKQFMKRVDISYINLTKVYNMVETWALEEVLENIGISKKFRELIMDINTGTAVSIITDFGKTKEFIAIRGIRQGCPLSPVLFCLFLELLVRWIRESEYGYKFKNKEELKIAILAYMDDIALIAKNRNEIRKMLRMVEEFCDVYRMRISEKSEYTSNKDRKEWEEPMKVQGITIKRIEKNEAYKYLGYWTVTDGNWEKHKKKARNKHQETINLLTGGSVNVRIKGKLINIVANTPLEYSFHSVPYIEEEIREMDMKNKKLIKRMMGISIVQQQC